MSVSTSSVLDSTLASQKSKLACVIGHAHSAASLDGASHAWHTQDGRMQVRLQLHCQIAGSYDMCDGDDPQLIAWQREILQEFTGYGMTARLEVLQEYLPALHFGLWMQPGEKPFTRQQLVWWEEAQAFAVATRRATAQAGALSPNTPDVWRQWAQRQVHASRLARLSPRQVGQLKALGILVAPVKRVQEVEKPAPVSQIYVAATDVTSNHSAAGQRQQWLTRIKHLVQSLRPTHHGVGLQPSL